MSVYKTLYMQNAIWSLLQDYLHNNFGHVFDKINGY
jgi:hypothetical protein